VTVVFDRVVIAVPDLASAVAQYSVLLGAEGEPPISPSKPLGEGAAQALYRLGNTVIALEERPVESARVAALVLGNEQHSGAEQAVQTALGIDVNVCSTAATNQRRDEAVPAESGLLVDHVVLQTDDAQGCIDLFSVALGIRLALDKTVEEWGGRMLFFRAGKMTLEVIASEKTPESQFWGIAYQCPDIDGFCQRLQNADVNVTNIREGRKPGTRVATLKSHCLGIPTLLIEPAVN